ncbi:NAD-dependent epimerase/dehydratase family protein [Marinivivus vitaminiproducens]|uniref:NAD-dependent epimerase/dehydratase family protein n=1 Tax=Marinivivus vitaminiproducens TaxID=3035935 RepID=UPI0027A93FE2|nr:NAD(P)-dependent oxidoreductase [Geminicoccaceae bacterium SCSIO 64248]
MTVLVTGATGFVGLNLIEHLLGEGRHVVAFADRPLPEPAAASFRAMPGRLDPVLGDVTHGDAVRRTIDAHGVTQVVHGAAITAGADRDRAEPERIVAVNVAGTAAVARAAYESGIGRFVHLSSIVVFGSRYPAEAVLDEETPTAPESLYGITKAAGEQVVIRLADLTGLDVRIGRLGTVFGPWEYATGLRDTLSSMHQAVRIARAGGIAHLARPCARTWHYARDTARNIAVLLDVEAPRHRLYHLADAPDWTLADWCDGLRRRHPDFSYTVGGEATGQPIDLYSSHDSGRLSGARFRAEFGTPSRHGLEEAQDAYGAWLDRHAGFGL